MEKLFNCDEVAEIFGIKKITVYDWIKQKKLGAICLGKNYAVREEDLIKTERLVTLGGEVGNERVR